MSVQLFPHNQIAYNSALEMLESCGKAAIVHPTGTGKSFIGFKLCEEKKNDTICWLSPSEYIFKTQIENLKKAGGDEPTNICFYTYAKLMLMSEEEMSAFSQEITGTATTALLKLITALPESTQNLVMTLMGVEQ